MLGVIPVQSSEVCFVQTEVKVICMTYFFCPVVFRSSDGSTLVVSSSDGYCSIVQFNEGELGEPYDLSIKQVLDRSNSPLTLNGDSSGWWPCWLIFEYVHVDRLGSVVGGQDKVTLRWCYKGRFAMTIFSATQHYNIVATCFRMIATLFQHCHAVLRSKSSLRIVTCTITFRQEIILPFLTH